MQCVVSGRRMGSQRVVSGMKGAQKSFAPSRRGGGADGGTSGLLIGRRWSPFDDHRVRIFLVVFALWGGFSLLNQLFAQPVPVPYCIDLPWGAR